jgi:general secretion pathway protein D
MKTFALVASMLLAMFSLALHAEDAGPAARAGKSNAYPTIPIFELIERVSKKSGKRFLVDPRVNVDVPLPGFDVSQVDYEALLAIFRLQQLATFTQNGVVNVVPDANSRQLPTPVLTTDDPRIAADELVTRVIRVENVCGNWLVPILRPLLPQAAHLAAHSPSSSLVLSDRAGNARRIAELVKQLDRGPKQSSEEPKSGS